MRVFNSLLILAFSFLLFYFEGYVTTVEFWVLNLFVVAIAVSNYIEGWESK